MKYSRHQFNKDTYQLWEKGMTIPAAQNSSSFVVKYRIGDTKKYFTSEIKAQSIEDALEQACFCAATESSASPEDIDLHSIYNINGELLWGDELPYALSNSKNDENGMSRREFLTAFGLANAALLFGLPKIVNAATTAVSLAGAASGFSYVDDVFSTYLYTGNSGTQTVINGIDLAGNGGLVWTKNRNSAGWHNLVDTARGRGYNLYTNSSEGVRGQSAGNANLTSFNSNGFSLGVPDAYSNINDSGSTLVAWTFRKSPKFFDVVTYIGNGVAGRQVSHALGIAPGFVITKSYAATGDWNVYHCDSVGDLVFNTTAARTASRTIITGADSNTFTVNGATNTNGVSYVAYLWAHDATGEGVVQCGVGYAPSGGGQFVNLGWEPQWVLVKAIDAPSAGSSLGGWLIHDQMRGNTLLQAHLSNTELDYGSGGLAGGIIEISATGFRLGNGFFSSNNTNYVYLAIRRPNKPPTTGTQVYNVIARTSTSNGGSVNLQCGFPTDLHLLKTRSSWGASFFWDRLRGNSVYLNTTSSSAESPNGPFAAVNKFLQDGVEVGEPPTGNAYINHFFRRAPGFMDVVCYTGTGTPRTVNHGLGVVPELIIVKQRNTSGNGWPIGTTSVGWDKYLSLDLTNGAQTAASVWNNTGPTTSTFTVGSWDGVNKSAINYVAYLFATLPGISKVGTYTGDETQGKVINCGFTTGARFVLIKRADNTGDWYVWDSARGIVAGNDPHVSLNTTAAEVTGDDSIDSINSGFIVNQMAATSINTLNANYIFLAIA